MITLFTIPKAFQGHNRIIQRNALQSCLKLRPKCEIILFGDDDGVAESAHELGIKHIPVVEKNEFGTPLLSSAFSAAQKMARNEILVYMNADIIFLHDLTETVKMIDQKQFLICGRRWDVDITQELDFSDNKWAEELLFRLKSEGNLHGPSGIDYFIFRRNSVEMPPFAVGRPGWDCWLIFEMRKRGVAVIDSTETITVIHQNHDYSHSKFGEAKRVGGPEFNQNIRLAGGYKNLFTLRDADWVLTKNGLSRPRFPRSVYSLLSLNPLWRSLLATKRAIYEKLR